MSPDLRLRIYKVTFDLLSFKVPYSNINCQFSENLKAVVRVEHRNDI